MRIRSTFEGGRAVSGVSEKAVEDEIISKRDTNWIAGSIVVSFICGAASIGLFWLGFSDFSLFRFPPEALERAAHFGDAFGFINAVISAGACAALVITLRMQAQQMKEQRESQRKDDERREKELKGVQRDRTRNLETMLLTAYIQCVATELRSTEIEMSDEFPLRAKKAFRRYEVGGRMRRAMARIEWRIKKLLPDDDDPASAVLSELVLMIDHIQNVLKLCHTNPKDCIANAGELLIETMDELSEIVDSCDELPVFGAHSVKLLQKAHSDLVQAYQAPDDQTQAFIQMIDNALNCIAEVVRTQSADPY